MCHRRENAIWQVAFFVHRNGFRAVNPLTGSVDLRIGLDRGDHGKSGDINFTSFSMILSRAARTFLWRFWNSPSA